MKKISIISILLSGLIAFSFLSADKGEECEKKQHLVVTGIISGGNAETSGIQQGDIIIAYNGKEVHCLEELGMLKQEVEIESVEIVIKRDADLISYMIPQGMIGVYVKEVLPDLEFEEDAMIIEGIGPLGWETGESNSFIAALTRIAEHLKIQKDYTYLMGTSGAAFRILFHKDWCPSSPDATVGFDCGAVAVKSINLEMKSMFDKEGKDRDGIRQKIIEAIDSKMPVIAIDLIEVPEWGLIVGYQKNGDELVVRTYFDKRLGYDIADKFPWSIMTVSKGEGEIDNINNLKNSLKIAQELYETEKYGKYYSGIAAIEYWIKKLQEDDFAAFDDERFNDVMLANAWIFERLADDRMFAAEYLKYASLRFVAHMQEKIIGLASIYETINKLMIDAETVAPYPLMMEKRTDWTDEMKQKEIEVLTAVLEKEKEAYSVIKEINEEIWNYKSQTMKSSLFN